MFRVEVDEHCFTSNIDAIVTMRFELNSIFCYGRILEYYQMISGVDTIKKFNNEIIEQKIELN